MKEVDLSLVPNAAILFVALVDQMLFYKTSVRSNTIFYDISS